MSQDLQKLLEVFVLLEGIASLISVNNLSSVHISQED